MKKINLKYLNFFHWGLWLLLVIIWNFGYPQATPLADVIVAIFLSLIFILLKKGKK
ncbi:hypothetical protein OAB36_02240 [Pelagibacteraceae bacterium]|jgi:hypothetical protein|nr:hypothetical protein [Pelagibacteraceae bacterium]|tara:strand:+ start:2762 stop:2929 length:168 start_codon:yes stop_codon:yes gene_type:complete